MHVFLNTYWKIFFNIKMVTFLTYNYCVCVFLFFSLPKISISHLTHKIYDWYIHKCLYDSTTICLCLCMCLWIYICVCVSGKVKVLRMSDVSLWFLANDDDCVFDWSKITNTVKYLKYEVFKTVYQVGSHEVSWCYTF